MTDPFLDLVVEALNLTHPRFAGAGGLAYPPEEAGGPGAAARDRERSFVREFYHQFRRLWDKALPVRLGLGHVMVQADPELSPQPDLLFWRLGEGGEPDRRLGAVSLVLGSNRGGWDAAVVTLTAATQVGYPRGVLVLVGRDGDFPAAPAGVTAVRFDTDRWQAVLGV